MRWEALFADMEAQLEAAERLALESEISERARMDQSAIEFADRLRGQTGHFLKFRLQGGRTFAGTLTHTGSGWLMLEEGVRSVLIPLGAVRFVEGLTRSTAPAGAAGGRRLGLASAFRALARDRAEVMVYLGDEGGGYVSGTIDRVGRDFLEMAVLPAGEPRRPGNSGTVYAVPFAAVTAAVSQR